MRWISRFVQRWSSKPAPPPPVDVKPMNRSDERSGLKLFNYQLRLEADGKAAAIAGKSSTYNPYLNGTMEWNRWKFGFEREALPWMCHLDGSPMLLSTATDVFPKITEYLLRHRDGSLTLPDGSPVDINKRST